MFYRNLSFVLCICVLIQSFECMVVSKKPKECQKFGRQLSNRIKNAAKDFKYITNSYDCNIRYIFDGVYSGFYSNVDELNELFEKSAGNVLEKCKKTYDFSILSQQPYDVCYKNNGLSEQFAKFDRWEEGVNAICQNCDVDNEQECIVEIKEMSDELEDFKNSINAVVKDIEKKVENCVKEMSKKVDTIFEDLTTKFNSCVHSI